MEDVPDSGVEALDQVEKLPHPDARDMENGSEDEHLSDKQLEQNQDVGTLLQVKTKRVSTKRRT